MKLEIQLRKPDIFKSNFEAYIIPKIYESINNGEIKVVLSRDYINETLNISYEMMYLFLKIKEILLDTDLNVSVRKLKKQYVFYKKVSDVNRESDLFKVNFENDLKTKILEILKTTDSIIFEESFLKEYLKTNYETDSLYKKIRDMLLDNNITLSVRKNIITNNNKSNHFVFYKKDESKPQKYYEKVNFDKEIDLDIEDWKKYDRESLIEDEEIKEDIHKKSFEGLAKALSINVENYCECPICKKSIEYLTETCKYCGIMLKWE